jgi:ElaB/YqjD/DUF883 family membrane-anchored ribosome-binding protein
MCDAWQRREPVSNMPTVLILNEVTNMADQQDKKSKNTGGVNPSPMTETNISKTPSSVPNASSTPTMAGGGAKNETSINRAQPSTGGTATATARSFYDQAKETAGQAYEVVTDKAATKLEEQKSTLTGGLSTVADSIRQAGDKLGSPENKSGLTETAAKYTDTAAEKIEQAARYFEQRDVKQMVRDVENYAKRNPAVFIGAAFAAGMLLSRFLKAGTPNYVGGDGEGFNRGSGSMSGSAGMNSNVRDFGGNAEQRTKPDSQTTGDTGANRI